MNTPNSGTTFSQIPPRSRNEFRIAIICALPLEASMIELVLDNEWDHSYGKALGDANTYTTGTIGDHNVVLAYMPKMGSNSAAVTASGLRSSYPKVEFVFVVGLCGAVPTNPETGEEICLGDCIISTAVIQYDYGRRYPGGFARKSEESLEISKPETLAMIAKLNNPRNRRRLADRLSYYLENLKADAAEDFDINYPGGIRDRLFESHYPHKHTSFGQDTCESCLLEFDTCTKDCDMLHCDLDQLRSRQRLQSQHNLQNPRIHFGRYGSANTVLRSGSDRDTLASKDHLIAFEMESSGIWTALPSVLVIKSACDYADSHKNKEWQVYAAATAAAATKAVLEKLELAEEDFIHPHYPSFVIPSAESRSNTQPSLTVQSLDAHTKFHTKELASAMWLLPFGRDEDFTGRKDILKDLWQAFEDRRAGYQLSLALVGMGGIGKSQIAIEFAYQIHQKYNATSVFWIHASTASRFEQGYREIASKAKLSIPEEAETLEVVHRYLSEELDDWIIILDNVDDNETFTTRRENSKTLRDFLPVNPRGTILVTSRNRLATTNLVGSRRIFDIDSMPLEDSLDLLRTRLSLDDADSEDAQTLIESLESLPLAITHAAAYISARRMTIARYLALFRSERSQRRLLNDDHLADSRRDGIAARTVMTTWQISFEAIADQEPGAAELLKLLCMYDNQSIPETLLQTWYGPDGQPVAEDNEFDNGEDNDEDDDNRIQEFLEEHVTILASFSLVKIEDSKSLSVKIHRLVQLSMRQWLQQNDELVKWESNAIRMVAQCFHASRRSSKEIDRLLLPHAERAIKYEPTDLATSQKWLLASLLTDYMKLIGKYSAALQYSFIKLKIVEQLEGNNPMIMFNTLVWHCLHLQDQGLFREVDKIIDQIDAKYRQLPSPKQPANDTTTHPSKDWLPLFEDGSIFNDDDYPSIAENFAQVLAVQGRHDECKPLFRYALHRGMTESATESLELAITKNNFAISLALSDNLDEAEQLHNEVWHTRRSLLGEEHPDTLSSAQCVASMISRRGHYEEAEALYRKTYLARMEILGEHPHTLTTLSNVALELSSLERYEESISMFRDAIVRCTRTLGKDHYLTLTSKHNLASVLGKVEGYDEAIPYCKEALAGLQATDSDRNMWIWSSADLLCRLLEAKKDWAGAEETRRQILEQIPHSAAGEDKRFFDSSKLVLNLINQNNTEKFNEAEILCRQALAYATKNFGPEHDHTRNVIFQLGKCLEGQKKWVEAESVRRDLLAQSLKTESIEGRKNPSPHCVATAMHNVGYTLFKQGQYEEAEIFFRDAVNRLDIDPPDHPDDQAISARWLWETLLAQRRILEANELLADWHKHESEGKPFTEEQEKKCHWCIMDIPLDYQMTPPSSRGPTPPLS